MFIYEPPRPEIPYDNADAYAAMVELGESIRAAEGKE